jgi:hypothetical protein
MCMVETSTLMEKTASMGSCNQRYTWLIRGASTKCGCSKHQETASLLAYFNGLGLVSQAQLREIVMTIVPAARFGNEMQLL